MNLETAFQFVAYLAGAFAVALALAHFAGGRILRALAAALDANTIASWYRAAGVTPTEQADYEHLGIEAAQVGLTPDQARSLFVKWARGEVDA